jgi:hypothetical protein
MSTHAENPLWDLVSETASASSSRPTEGGSETDLGNLALPACLDRGAEGAIRISGHRVSLFLVLDALFKQKTISEIKGLYPTIETDLLWQVALFCAGHAAAVRSYYEQELRRIEALEHSVQHAGPTLEELRRLKAQKSGKY